VRIDKSKGRVIILWGNLDQLQNYDEVERGKKRISAEEQVLWEFPS
jgi:hypothetical protein